MTLQISLAKTKILSEKKSSDSFVVIGKTLHDMYYIDKCMTSQKEFLAWTKAQLGFSKSTTYEYIISYRIFSEIETGLVALRSTISPPSYQSHCQLLAKIPKEQLLSSWIGAVESSKGNVITTAILESYLESIGLLNSHREKKRKPSKKTPKKPKTDYYTTSEDEEDEIPDFEDDEQERRRIHRQRRQRHSHEHQSITPPLTAHPTPSISPDPSSVNTSEGSQLSELLLSQISHEPSDSRDNFIQINPAPIQIATPTFLSDNSSFSNIGSFSTQNPSSNHMLSSPLITDNELPFDPPFLKQVSKSVVNGQQFDIVLNDMDEFKSSKGWYGRVWCCLPFVQPVSTQVTQTQSPTDYFMKGGLERVLQIIFTKFANKEFTEGVFLIKAELGADWCTPVLQHPFCILRHVSLVHTEGNRKFDSYIVFYLGQNEKQFCHVFRGLGLVSGINFWSATTAAAPEPMQKNISFKKENSTESSLQEVATALCHMGRHS